METKKTIGTYWIVAMLVLLALLIAGIIAYSSMSAPLMERKTRAAAPCRVGLLENHKTITWARKFFSERGIIIVECA